MTRGSGRSTGKRNLLLLAALIGLATGCAEDKPDNAAQGGLGGTGARGGDGGDASIEDASDTDSEVDESGGGTGGAGAGGPAGSGGQSGAGAGGGGEGGESGKSGAGGSGAEGGEPALDGGDDPDAGPQDAVCFAGGSESGSTASGECADPILIDMSGLDFGDAVFHRTGTAATNAIVPSLEKCAEGTGRDIVFNVKTSGTADLEISVDAQDGSDPIILVQDGPDTECDKAAATACVDDTGAAECEYLRVSVSTGGYVDNTPQVVIAETAASSAALTVRFRLIDPGGGS